MKQANYDQASNINYLYCYNSNCNFLYSYRIN